MFFRYALRVPIKQAARYPRRVLYYGKSEKKSENKMKQSLQMTCARVGSIEWFEAWRKNAESNTKNTNGEITRV